MAKDDDTEPLTKEQKDTFLRWLKSKAKDHNCPVCGHGGWHLGPDIINAFPQGKEVQITGTVYPQVFLVCANCSFVQYFMAIGIGIIEREEDTEEQPSGDGVDG